MNRRKTPQEKKRLSYAKDHRNVYGENDKASRKNLPRTRARVHRANRHRAHQILLGATVSTDTAIDTATADAVEQKLSDRRPHTFRKSPDLALGEHVRWKRARRAAQPSAAS